MKNTQNRPKAAGKRGAFYAVHLVDPDHMKISIDALADALIAMKQVSEVYVSDSSETNGFLIKIRFDEGNWPQDPAQFLEKRIDRKFGRIITP